MTSEGSCGNIKSTQDH